VKLEPAKQHKNRCFVMDGSFLIEDSFGIG
jgi:hypothetical protein